MNDFNYVDTTNKNILGNDGNNHYELNLPVYLTASLSKTKEAQKKIDSGKEYFRYDCDYCELQSDINAAEVDGEISSDRAWYLRGKYLGLSRETMETI